MSISAVSGATAPSPAYDPARAAAQGAQLVNAAVAQTNVQIAAQATANIASATDALTGVLVDISA